MGFYSNVIIPFFYDYSMDSQKINEGRKIILGRITEDEILEIGFGTGINLKFYPENVKKIIGIEPNEGMIKKFRKKSGNDRIKVKLLLQSGESLPFPDNSINAVISTYTLCSIKNINSALKEIYRILIPGGKYYFLEHGLADNPKIQKWQNRLNSIQKVCAGGCNLNRNIKLLLTDSGLKISELRNYYRKGDTKIGGYTYEGIAAK